MRSQWIAQKCFDDRWAFTSLCTLKWFWDSHIKSILLYHLKNIIVAFIARWLETFYISPSRSGFRFFDTWMFVSYMFDQLILAVIFGLAVSAPVLPLFSVPTHVVISISNCCESFFTISTLIRAITKFLISVFLQTNMIKFNLIRTLPCMSAQMHHQVPSLVKALSTVLTKIYDRTWHFLSSIRHRVVKMQLKMCFKRVILHEIECLIWFLYKRGVSIRVAEKWALEW